MRSGTERAAYRNDYYRRTKVKLKVENRMTEAGGRQMKLIILRPERRKNLPGILWIHGGGYMLGMAGMVHFSEAKMLAKKYGAVVISPEYRLAKEAPYPAALDDCYEALRYMYDNAEELGIDPGRIVVGGESAGGGLAAAVCLLARDRKEVPVFFHIPLYPMLDCEDTETSRDNHGRVWNTKKNHWGWSNYLGELYGTDRVPKYASPARETDWSGMPPCYTFVTDGEPFYKETITYVRKLKQAGVEAKIDVYHSDIHAFDYMFWTKKARKAKQKLCDAFRENVIRYKADYNEDTE